MLEKAKKKVAGCGLRTRFADDGCCLCKRRCNSDVDRLFSVRYTLFTESQFLHLHELLYIGA